MYSSLKHTLFGLLILTMFGIAGCGSQDGQTDEGTVIEESHADHDHEGDDHAMSDDHAGHDHPPDEHGQTGHEGNAHAASSEEALDWCATHSVPESECTACHPELIEDFKASGDWCGGHGLPESHCRLCNPGISFPQEEVMRTRASELAEGEMEIMLNFRPNAEMCATDGALIQFASTTTAERAGLTVHQVRSTKQQSILEAPAEIVFDETELNVVSSTVPALVSRWLVSPGDRVMAGDVLAIVKSPEIARLKSSLLTAHADYRVEQRELERQQSLLQRDFISEAEFDRQTALTQRVEASLTSAEGLLLSAGLDSSDIRQVIEQGDMSHEFLLRATVSGMVVDRIAQLGDLRQAGQAFVTIANPRAMWVEARLTEKQLRHVDLGQQLTFSSDARGMNRVGGEIIWISRFVDPHTRTGTVRARVLDPQHDLRAGEFGRVRVVDQQDQMVSLVPKDAVQWEGCCNVVFVKETDDRFRPRKVQLLDSEGAYYQVADGVMPGEQVVVDGAFLLKTELKKSSIGAGCCGLDPVG